MHQYNQYYQYYQQQHYPPPKLPGQTMLLVTGILLIVFNSIGSIMLIGTLAMIDTWLWQFGGNSMRALWQIIYTVGILVTLAAVGLGILGIAFSTKADKAKVLLAAVAAVLVVTMLYNIVFVMMVMQYEAGLAVLEIITMPLGFVVPIIFIVGAVRNNNFHKNLPNIYNNHS